MLGLEDERGRGGRRCKVFARGSPKSVVVAVVSIPIHPPSIHIIRRKRERERKSAIGRRTILRTFVRQVSGDSMFLSFAHWFGGGYYLPSPVSRGYL